jgi:hypothetical protein
MDGTKKPAERDSVESVAFLEPFFSEMIEDLSMGGALLVRAPFRAGQEQKISPARFELSKRKGVVHARLGRLGVCLLRILVFSRGSQIGHSVRPVIEIVESNES